MKKYPSTWFDNGSTKSLPDCMGIQADRLTNQRSPTASTNDRLTLLYAEYQMVIKTRINPVCL